MSHSTEFNIFESTIDAHRRALDAGIVTSVELVVRYLLRIGTYDIRGGLNSFTVFNPSVLDEARASDARRAAGKPARPLEGIPYTLKDSFKYEGLTVTNGSPALEGLKSSGDSHIASRLRAAGAVLLGKTNMPPMAAGGMQRGLYGRAESPYNSKYLTAAFSSGSSNGAATSTTTSMAVFGMGSETVSSGRSPASNNALVAYTPSRGILSCRGLWPLYVTCDVPVPYARTVKDLLEILAVISEQDTTTQGDFWRAQSHVDLPKPPQIDYTSLPEAASLSGKRIGVPKLYVGEKDSHPNAKYPAINNAVIGLWQSARADLEALGAEVVLTDFPLVTNYEDDSISQEPNNVVGAPASWNQIERGELVAKAWDEFLRDNGDRTLPSISDVDANLLFPKPKGFVPDTFLELRNVIDYARLPVLADPYKQSPLVDFPGLDVAAKALEAQRKRDLEDWMDELGLDLLTFPANGDVGLSDLEVNLESARHSLQNGVRYSNGNRALRHLGVPTVSVPMGIMADAKMPVNLTFAGKAYDDDKLLQYAYAFEQKSHRRVIPPLSPALHSDVITKHPRAVPESTLELQAVLVEQDKERSNGAKCIRVSGTVKAIQGVFPTIEIYVDGRQESQFEATQESWEVTLPKDDRPPQLSWNLEPLEAQPAIVLILAGIGNGQKAAEVKFLDNL